MSVCVSGAAVVKMSAGTGESIFLGKSTRTTNAFGGDDHGDIDAWFVGELFFEGIQPIEHKENNETKKASTKKRNQIK